MSPHSTQDPHQAPKPFLMHKTVLHADSSSVQWGSHGDLGFVIPQRRRLDRLVWKPLCRLAEMLVGPQQLVKKRLDKLLDYEEIQERKSETGSVTYDEEAAMNTYLAINALLVAELPRFNQVAMQLLGQLLGSFSVLQQDLATEVLHEAKKEVEQVRGGGWVSLCLSRPACFGWVRPSPLLAGLGGCGLGAGPMAALVSWLHPKLTSGSVFTDASWPHAAARFLEDGGGHPAAVRRPAPYLHPSV